MSSTKTIEQPQARGRHYHDRVTLPRATLYRRGLTPNARLQSLERELERAQRRLRDARLRAKP